VASTPFRYRSPEEDSARWLGFPFRDGDIVFRTKLRLSFKYEDPA